MSVKKTLAENAMKESKKKNGKEKPIKFDTLSLWGTNYKTIVPKRVKERPSWVKPNEKEIKAFIPGTIIRIYIAEKSKIKKGDKLLVLEAMKMKNEIIATRDGTVKKILVKPGDRIPKGHIMIEFE